VPEVLPVLVTDVDAVVLFNVMVLDVACGFGVKLTVIDVVVVWLNVGAAGLANWVSANVTDADAVPTGEFENVVPSPMDVMVASYV
jgi:hypothetical protein